MFNMKALFLRAMLALSIALGAPVAMAGPIYHVSVDTSSLSGAGFLSLSMSGFDDSGTPKAFASNFSGNFGADAFPQGDVSGNIIDGVHLGIAEVANYLDQAVTFGGLFSFDVRFDGVLGDAASTFGVALLGEDFMYVGGFGNLVDISLIPDGTINVDLLAPGLVSVAEVPEPGEWMLLATGLLLIGMTRRMQLRR